LGDEAGEVVVGVYDGLAGVGGGGGGLVNPPNLSHEPF
jgi:hypothetical protein